MHKFFFITGMLRSGTTLVNTLLNTGNSLSLHQRLTSLFIETKTSFLKRKNISDYHILTNFFQGSYFPTDVSDFLAEKSFYKTYKSALLSLENEKELLGSKEVLCEEFISHFLDNEIKVILCIRDPRDIIASMHYGTGVKYVGMHRPILFDIRNWRKSIAFAIQFQNHPNLLTLRYEKLVTFPQEEYKKLADFIGLDILDFDQINNSEKLDWQNNSSFSNKLEGISKESMGISSKILPHQVINLIQATCYPELKWLNYEITKDWIKAPDILNFNDPFITERPEFISFNYKEELVQEIDRLLQLKKGINEDCSKFIFEKALAELKVVSDFRWQEG